MHSLVASCMCSDWGSNPHPWHIGVMFYPTELPGIALPYLILVLTQYLLQRDLNKVFTGGISFVYRCYDSISKRLIIINLQ